MQSLLGKITNLNLSQVLYIEAINIFKKRLHLCNNSKQKKTIIIHQDLNKIFSQLTIIQFLEQNFSTRESYYIQKCPSA